MFTKHFIRLNENNEIIKAFSTAFEQPIEGDVLLDENMYRHTTEYMPILAKLIDQETGQYLLKYIDNQIITKTHDELYTPEVITQIENEKTKGQLQSSDSKMIRKIDEIYSVLITKGIINKDDFIDKVTGINYFNDDIEEREVLREKL